MWVLDFACIGEGSGKYWSKVLTVGPFSPLESPLGIWKDETLLMRRMTHIFSLSGFEIWFPRIDRGFGVHNVFNYVGSLTSVYGTIEEQAPDSEIDEKVLDMLLPKIQNEW